MRDLGCRKWRCEKHKCDVQFQSDFGALLDQLVAVLVPGTWYKYVLQYLLVEYQVQVHTCTPSMIEYGKRLFVQRAAGGIWNLAFAAANTKCHCADGLGSFYTHSVQACAPGMPYCPRWDLTEPSSSVVDEDVQIGARSPMYNILGYGCGSTRVLGVVLHRNWHSMKDSCRLDQTSDIDFLGMFLATMGLISGHTSAQSTCTRYHVVTAS